MKTLITHNSVFHCDEVMATAILSNLFGQDDVKIIRTNRPEKYSDEDDIIIYDIGMGLYDHHQKGGNGVRDNNVPYAACGLIWKSFGKALIEVIANQMEVTNNDEIINRVFNIIDCLIIQGIDANDNGYRSPDYQKGSINYFNISNMVFSFNTIACDGGVNSFQQEINFRKAVDLCSQILISNIRKYLDAANSESILHNLIVNNTYMNILVLNKYIPWIKYITENTDDIWYVIFPSARNEREWNMQAVPLSADTFEQRHPVPNEWWGGNAETLPKITGIPEATFCHQSNGFLTAAKSLDAIIKLAILACNGYFNINEELSDSYKWWED